MGFLNENDSLAYFAILGELSSTLSFIVGFFKTLSFLSLLVCFSGGKEGFTSQHPNSLVGLRRPNIKREFFWLSALNLKDISYNGDSRETLDKVHVKYVLPKGALMSKTIATFVQKVGLIWLKDGLLLSYSGHKYNYWLKIVTHLDKPDNSVMCTEKEV